MGTEQANGTKPYMGDVCNDSPRLSFRINDSLPTRPIRRIVSCPKDLHLSYILYLYIFARNKIPSVNKRKQRLRCIAIAIVVAIAIAISLLNDQHKLRTTAIIGIIFAK